MEVLAFYLPQFHPIPENDAWWGKGFTEWRNVVASRPRFAGHWQPHLPSDLGFVDLRVPEILREQARLAAQYGVTGFVMYHYWFGGRQLLERPVQSILADPAWPGRFCICWANETWSRAWDGREHDVLMQQVYSEEDDRRHARHIAELMADARYIRVDGRPLFMIYRPAGHPNLERFRRELVQRVQQLIGVPPLLLGVRSGFDGSVTPPWLPAVDGTVGFQPNGDYLVLANRRAQLLDLAKRTIPSRLYQKLKRTGSAVKRVDYVATVRNIVKGWRELPRLEYPCVFPNWDNSPRRATPTVIQNPSPKEFGGFVREAIAYLSRAGVPQGPLFVNAWNEWAEGCHLEPDMANGTSYLEELASALGIGPTASSGPA